MRDSGLALASNVQLAGLSLQFYFRAVLCGCLKIMKLQSARWQCFLTSIYEANNNNNGIDYKTKVWSDCSSSYTARLFCSSSSYWWMAYWACDSLANATHIVVTFVEVTVEHPIFPTLITASRWKRHCDWMSCGKKRTSQFSAANFFFFCT